MKNVEEKIYFHILVSSNYCQSQILCTGFEGWN